MQTNKHEVDLVSDQRKASRSSHLAFAGDRPADVGDGPTVLMPVNSACRRCNQAVALQQQLVDIDGDSRHCV